MNTSLLSIVVPCYNEEKNIPIIFSKFSELINDENAELIFVENGSTDNSEKIFSELFKNTPNDSIRIVKVQKNIGYGNGILRGLETARGNVLAWTHADLQTDPADVLRAFKSYQEKLLLAPMEIFVKGTRKKRRLTEAFFSWAMEVFSSILLQKHLTEINAQPKLFSRNFYHKHLKDNAPLDFSLDLFAVYQAKTHATILEIPVFFKKRIHGEAKGGGSFRTRIKLIKRTFSYILQLRSRLKK